MAIYCKRGKKGRGFGRGFRGLSVYMIDSFLEFLSKLCDGVCSEERSYHESEGSLGLKGVLLS